MHILTTLTQLGTPTLRELTEHHRTQYPSYHTAYRDIRAQLVTLIEQGAVVTWGTAKVVFVRTEEQAQQRARLKRHIRTFIEDHGVVTGLQIASHTRLCRALLRDLLRELITDGDVVMNTDGTDHRRVAYRLKDTVNATARTVERVTEYLRTARHAASVTATTLASKLGLAVAHVKAALDHLAERGVVTAKQVGWASVYHVIQEALHAPTKALKAPARRPVASRPALSRTRRPVTAPRVTPRPVSVARSAATPSPAARSTSFLQRTVTLALAAVSKVHATLRTPQKPETEKHRPKRAPTLFLRPPSYTLNQGISPRSYRPFLPTPRPGRSTLLKENHAHAGTINPTHGTLTPPEPFRNGPLRCDVAAPHGWRHRPDPRTGAGGPDMLATAWPQRRREHESPLPRLAVR